MLSRKEIAASAEMYLKRIELIGFKSFADPTVIEFGPGMTAIVGPNGCGKSNIVDAVRWVLGEQSVKSLRGEKMEDCIFKGTDKRKPLGMAEVSLTFSDCEEVLGLEFNEVTITRRVLRSGEGQYFINRNPCRLKDIQRLFMDTGIGASSYAILEQGRIDQILSARPDDRRAAFEEASGITRYKADKREAVRKLQRVEENLLRVADIVREVKRQMISLQRQAGKARRYQQMHRRMRTLELWLGRRRLEELDRRMRELELSRARLQEQVEAIRAELERAERRERELREEAARLEESVAAKSTEAVRIQSAIENARRTAAMCRERVEELRRLSERDQRDAEAADRLCRELRARLSELVEEKKAAASQVEKSAGEYRRVAEELAALEKKLAARQRELQERRDERVDLESRTAQLHNRLLDADAEQRNRVLRHERLLAEKVQIERAVSRLQGELQGLGSRIEAGRRELREAEARLQAARRERQEREERLRAVREELTRQEAAGAVLRERRQALGAAGAAAPQALLERLRRRPQEADKARILGVLGELVEAEDAFQTAAEAALHAWADAVVVESEEQMRGLLEELDRNPIGTLQLLAAQVELQGAAEAPDGAGERLLDHMRYPRELGGLMERILGGVRVVDALQDVPYPVLEGVTYVTRDGVVVRSGGRAEIWAADENAPDTLTRSHLEKRLAARAREVEEVARSLRNELAELESACEGATREEAEGARAVEELRRAVAVAEGEYKVVAAQAEEARQRLETVEFEVSALEAEAGSGEERRRLLEEQEACRRRQAQLQEEIRALVEEIRRLEESRGRVVREVTEKRMAAGEAELKLQNIEAELTRLEEREREVQGLAAGRSEEAEDRTARIAALEREAEESLGSIARREQELTEARAELERLKERRSRNAEAYRELQENVQAQRERLEEARKSLSELEVRVAEARMERNAVCERLQQEYRVGEEEIMAAEEPEAEDGAPLDRDRMEAEVAEIRARLDSMGPVNLVALDELEELKKRYEFLTSQQEDLIGSRKQLMELINRINRITREKFSRTFEEVNRNFQHLFRRLFGGGSAKLLLVDEADLLESGIEIIASPPGKKLQSISLLSGGERTLAAVALLFALYRVKPSPFCLLDELDAALDDANIQRFVEVLREFLEDAQFIVISHNRRTVSAADTLYGITMEEDGVSRVISVKLSGAPAAVAE